MERKTKIHAVDGTQEIIITREFDLPLEKLFMAYEKKEIFEQWMGTKVLKLENKRHGSFQFETSDPNGNVVFKANGTIHEFVREQKITRTFEMENSEFPVQLEFLEFENLSGATSKLTMHIIFKSVEFRDKLLKMPFEFGLNLAHNRLQEIVSKLL